MRQISYYLVQYLRQASQRSHFIILLILSLLISVNYHFNLYNELQSRPIFGERFTALFLLFTVAFITSFLLVFRLEKGSFPQAPFFYVLLFASPVVFALKAAVHTGDVLPRRILDGSWGHYLEIILQWPLKAAIVLAAVCLLWTIGRYGRPLAGLSTRAWSARPYLLLLGAMLPLLALASLTEDFRQVYPKAAMIDTVKEQAGHWLRLLLFEICYGIDFFTIELFFRGFLVLAFARYAGVQAILPIAVFYCTIHFGKPLVECISSFPGGLILGVIVYNTRNIWGGLLVHLGIAWGMELMGMVSRTG